MNTENVNIIYGINGPVVTVKGKTNLMMGEMVYVGNSKLVGEVIRLDSGFTTIQVYEETSGLKPGEIVHSTGGPIQVTLGPGIIKGIFDGVQNPLTAIADLSGDFIPKGISVPQLNEEMLWDVTITVEVGDYLNGGDIYAYCDETPMIKHFIMTSPDVCGEVVEVKPNGNYRINDFIISVKDRLGAVQELTLCHKWPIRTPRPIANRLRSTTPLLTGQRVFDTLFPIVKGGTAAIPGGFGTGKTMTQHQLAKWSDADLIVYVGCGERGNEMTQALTEFGEIVDPRSGKPLTDRTVLIANTSNMPVAAREASIYTGITIAEYYRDMGYHAAIMADSTSRWAEALREISGRLEEMPAEEGFPAYLPSRLSEFYERAGYVKTLSGNEGSITVIGSVSPQGSDFSEPVTQNTKRFTRCFWALDKELAYSRHYPAINWNESYSEYIDDTLEWYSSNLDFDYQKNRNNLLSILIEENSLLEIVKLIGADILPDDQKLVMEIARVVRVGYLQQNATHDTDTYVPIKKQYAMMKVILHLFERCKETVENQIPVSKVKDSGIFEKLIRMKYDIPNDNISLAEDYIVEIDSIINTLLRNYGVTKSRR